MGNRIKFWTIVLSLILLGGGMALYKHEVYGIPLRPGHKPSEWLVEAKISFLSLGGPSSVKLGLPDTKRGVTWDTGIDAGSSGYSFIVETSADGDQTAVWSSDSREGEQALYFRVRFPETGVDSAGSVPAFAKEVVVKSPGFSGNLKDAAESVVRRVKELSSTPDMIFYGIFKEITALQATQEIALLKDSYRKRLGDQSVVQLGIDLLHEAEVAARLAYGIRLEESRGSQDPQYFVEYLDGVYWKVRDPGEAARELSPRDYFIWNRGGDPLLEVDGSAENSKVVFTTIRDRIPLERLTNMKDSGILVSTIFGLPASERQVFRFVVLIPIGAFVVVVMRNLIGVPTLGTFMPVLIALSLLEMSNIWDGLLMFVIIISVGLWFRFLLSQLNMLVVPRVAACVVIVTLLMMVLSVVSFQLGIREGLKITLFPMIILAWTIERMSLIWEEDGKKKAIFEVIGSLVVAVIAFFIMRDRQVRYLVFYFPELLLVLLAGIIMIGRYTGYRVSEFYRFRNFESIS